LAPVDPELFLSEFDLPNCCQQFQTEYHGLIVRLMVKE
jgi:hypothetical protein